MHHNKKEDVMAFIDKRENTLDPSDDARQDKDGRTFSPADLIISGRNQLTRSEQLLAADTRRNARNMLASAKLLVLVVVVSLAMGVAAWAFLASLNIATDYREHHEWIYALLPVVGLATAWVATTWSSTPLWAHASSICAWPSSPSSAPRSRT
jgi:hypothetical protein